MKIRLVSLRIEFGIRFDNFVPHELTQSKNFNRK